MDPDGSNKINITDTKSSNESHPHWSPMSKMIIFNSTHDDPFDLDKMEFAYGEEIYEMKADGSDIRRLTNWDLWDIFSSISPDGRFIVWRRVIAADSSSDRRFNSEIFIMNRDGSEPNNISNDPSFDGYPTWSFDGTKIIFVSNRSGEEQIYTMGTDGTGVHRLIESKDIDARPVWSLDGTRIVFNRERDGTVEIHILHLAQ